MLSQLWKAVKVIMKTFFVASKFSESTSMRLGNIFRSTVSTNMTTTYSISLESEIRPEFFCWVLVVFDRRDFFQKIQVWTFLPSLIQYNAQMQQIQGKYGYWFTLFSSFSSTFCLGVQSSFFLPVISYKKFDFFFSLFSEVIWENFQNLCLGY